MSRSKFLIAPSLLAADFMNLSSEIASVFDAGADWLHLDVMDGNFVPPITFGSQFVSQISSLFPSFPLDVHLMVNEPEQHFTQFIEAGAHAITFHIEACTHVHRALVFLKNSNVLAGLSLIPSTPVLAVTNVLAYADLVLVMSVNPGYGGQEFIVDSLDKIVELDTIRKNKGYKFKISVDGGVNLDNARLLHNLGIDILVAGTSIFKVDDRKEIINKLNNG